MDILSLIGWRAPGADQKAAAAPPDFAVGDRLQGRVVRLLHRQLALVDLLGGRFKAVAELKAPLDAGQPLHLEVTATAPRLTFQAVDAAPATAAGGRGGDQLPPTIPPALSQLPSAQQARQTISDLTALARALQPLATTGSGEAGAVVGALERLAGHLTPLDPQADPQLVADRLRTQIQDGGHFFERKLVDAARDGLAPSERAPAAGAESGRAAPTGPLPALTSDLKPQLQRLLLQLPALMETLAPEQALGSEGTRRLWTTVTTILDEIESGPSRLAAQRHEDPPVVMRHSMWVEGREEPLRFNVHLGRKGRRGGPPQTDPIVSLLLDLERFGRLRVDVRERTMGEGRGLTVAFWTETEAVRADLEAVGAPLAALLEVLYPQVHLAVDLAPERIAAFEKQAPQRMVVDDRRSRLDIRI